MRNEDTDELVRVYSEADVTHDGYGRECGVLAVARHVLSSQHRDRWSSLIKESRPDHILLWAFSCHEVLGHTTHMYYCPTCKLGKHVHNPRPGWPPHEQYITTSTPCPGGES